MSRSTATMDLEEQFHSVKHAIWQIYPVGSKARVLESRPNTLVRPSWRVSYLTHRDEQLTSRRYRQVVDWIIDYYGISRADVMDKMNAFERSIKFGGKRFRWVNLIPAWRFDWQYPEVVLTTAGDGSLVPGSYLVRVSAVDLCDNESAASVAQEVVVAAPKNSIGVRIPRVPYSQPLFKKYNVYVNGHREVSVDLPERYGGAFYPQTAIKNLLGSGPAPLEPSDTVRVRWQFLRVTGYAAGSREDDVTNGVFTGNITLQTTVEQEHDREQAPLIQYVEAETTLNVDDKFTIVVGEVL
jgi:hypothetical protein